MLHPRTVAEVSRQGYIRVVADMLPTCRVTTCRVTYVALETDMLMSCWHDMSRHIVSRHMTQHMSRWKLTTYHDVATCHTTCRRHVADMSCRHDFRSSKRHATCRHSPLSPSQFMLRSGKFDRGDNGINDGHPPPEGLHIKKGWDGKIKVLGVQITVSREWSQENGI